MKAFKVLRTKHYKQTRFRRPRMRVYEGKLFLFSTYLYSNDSGEANHANAIDRYLLRRGYRDFAGHPHHDHISVEVSPSEWMHVFYDVQPGEPQPQEKPRQRMIPRKVANALGETIEYLLATEPPGFAEMLGVINDSMVGCGIDRE